jgi:hypothetical protein
MLEHGVYNCMLVCNSFGLKDHPVLDTSDVFLHRSKQGGAIIVRVSVGSSMGVLGFVVILK